MESKTSLIERACPLEPDLAEISALASFCEVSGSSGRSSFCRTCFLERRIEGSFCPVQHSLSMSGLPKVNEFYGRVLDIQ